MAFEVQILKDYIENIETEKLPQVVTMFNDYWADNSSDTYATKIVEMGSFEPEDPYNEFNMFCKACNIKPLEVAQYLAYAYQEGLNPLAHFDTAFYAVFDRDGILKGDLYKITFPTNNEIKKLIASYSEELYEHFGHLINNDDIPRDHPVFDVLKDMHKKNNEKAR